MVNRCDWATQTPSMRAYHDTEWCRPEHDDQKLFELLCLETYQAGLSWQTVLNKRTAFQRDFYQFDLARLLADPAIIRNRLKLTATINNARVILNWSAPGRFSTWLWEFVGNQPIRHAVTSADQVPVTTDLGI